MQKQTSNSFFTCIYRNDVRRCIPIHHVHLRLSSLIDVVLRSLILHAEDTEVERGDDDVARTLTLL